VGYTISEPAEDIFSHRSRKFLRGGSLVVLTRNTVIYWMGRSLPTILRVSGKGITDLYLIMGTCSPLHAIFSLPPAVLILSFIIYIPCFQGSGP
jgi:hypothetical protein